MSQSQGEENPFAQFVGQWVRFHRSSSDRYGTVGATAFVKEATEQGLFMMVDDYGQESPMFVAYSIITEIAVTENPNIRREIARQQQEQLLAEYFDEDNKPSD